MFASVPQAVSLAESLKNVSKLVDAKFAALEAPATYRKNASPGAILEAASKRTNYRQEIRQIEKEALAPIREAEKAFAEADRYASFVLRCMHHLESGHDIGDVLNTEFANHIKSLRRSRLANVFEQSELDLLIRKCRQDVKEAMLHLQERSRHAKRWKRGIRKALLSNTHQTINAVLRQKGTAIPQAERASLKTFARKAELRDSAYGLAFKSTYYTKSGYKREIPAYRFESLRAL